jgi:hypothetical protein
VVVTLLLLGILACETAVVRWQIAARRVIRLVVHFRVGLNEAVLVWVMCGRPGERSHGVLTQVILVTVARFAIAHGGVACVNIVVLSLSWRGARSKVGGLCRKVVLSSHWTSTEAVVVVEGLGRSSHVLLLRRSISLLVRAETVVNRGWGSCRCKRFLWGTTSGLSLCCSAVLGKLRNNGLSGQMLVSGVGVGGVDSESSQIIS